VAGIRLGVYTVEFFPGDVTLVVFCEEGQTLAAFIKSEPLKNICGWCGIDLIKGV
jgi:hypothetical protein